MKHSKYAKSLKLKKSHIKHGIQISNALRLREVPIRKFTTDVMNEVKYGRIAVVVTDYGKRFGVFVPLPVEND